MDLLEEFLLDLIGRKSYDENINELMITTTQKDTL